MGAAGFTNAIQFNGLFLDARLQMIQCGQQPFIKGDGGTKMDGRGDNIITALSHIDMIIGTDGFNTAAGQCRQHLVEVHVAAGTGAGLKQINRKMNKMFTGDHLISRRYDGDGDIGCQ